MSLRIREVLENCSKLVENLWIGQNRFFNLRFLKLIFDKSEFSKNLFESIKIDWESWKSGYHLIHALNYSTILNPV